MKHQHWLLILCLMACLQLAPRLARAQSAAAQEEYLHHSYQEAIRKCKAQLEKNPDDGELLYSLANSYRLNGQMKEAEIWFSKAVLHHDDSRARLYYAQVLLCNRKYDAAKAAFLDYANSVTSEVDAANAKKIAAACAKLAADGPQMTDIQVQKADFNSDKLDFSPVFWKPGYLVFASNRPGTTGPEDAPDPWTADPFVDLWMVDVSATGKTGTPVPFAKELNSRYHEGPMAFSKNGTSMLFTRSDLQAGLRRGFDDKNNTRLKIYAAEWVGDEWVTGAELSINSSQFSTCHPALSITEDTLVFASDRPGGYGGMDLWFTVGAGNDWSAPENLGPSINTAGNEVFPTIGGDGNLYYSSDFTAGYGGLDIFKAGKGREGWGAPENMGAPINSSLDDYGLSVGEDGKHGHFSTNRGGLSDDIYSYLDMGDLHIEAVLVDCETGRPLRNVQVMTAGAATHVYTTDTAGKVRIPVLAGQDYQLQAYGEGYYGPEGCDGKAEVHVPSKGNELLPLVTLRLSRKNPCCFSFRDPDAEGNANLHYQWSTGDGHAAPGRSIDHCYERDGVYEANLEIVDADLAANISKYKKTIVVSGCQDQLESPLVVEGIIRDKHLGTPLPMAEVSLIDQCTGKAHVVMSDSSGRYQFVLPGKHDCDYWLIGKHQGYVQQENLLPVKGRTSALPLHQDMALDPEGRGQQQYAGGYAPQPSMNNPQGLPALPAGYVYVMPINGNAPMIPGRTPSEDDFSKPLGQGDVIELYNIYFDLAKHDIRPDAEIDLLFLLILMRKYPHMQGEIIAHTDSRNTDAYNLALSNRRAQAARDWLVARGVDPMRLRTLGFGEYQLRNQCTDGTYCNEVEHQRNRRVEFRVTHFDGVVINSKEYEAFVPRRMNASVFD